jgi:hypothetical protein
MTMTIKKTLFWLFETFAKEAAEQSIQAVIELIFKFWL